jgi:hypothetical protein
VTACDETLRECVGGCSVASPFQVTIWNLPFMMACSFLDFLRETFDRNEANAGPQPLPKAGATWERRL